jgi:hypothetical protein
MKTGIIKAIYDDGDFTTDYGHLYAYKMLIQFQGEQNQTEGGINSKSHPYPMRNGDEITVEIKDTSHGVKFKKVNPQYQSGSQGQSSGGGGSSKDTSIERQTAWKGACNRAQGSSLTHSDIEDLAMVGIHFIETGNRMPQQQTAKYTGNSQPDDDIPF